MPTFFSKKSVVRASDIVLHEFANGSYTELAKICACSRQHTHFVMTRGGMDTLSAYALILHNLNIAISDFINLVQSIDSGTYGFDDLQRIVNAKKYVNVTKQDIRDAMFKIIDVKSARFFVERTKFAEKFNLNPDHIGRMLSNPTIKTAYMFCQFYELDLTKLIMSAEEISTFRHNEVTNVK